MKIKNTLIISSLGILLALFIIRTDRTYANSTTNISSIVCQHGQNNPEISLTKPANNSLSSMPTTELEFNINWGKKITISNNGTNIISDQEITYQDSLSFAQKITLSQGKNNIKVKLTGGCPSSTIEKDFSIDFDNSSIAIDKLFTNKRSPALSGTLTNENASIELKLNNKVYQAVNNGNGTWQLAEGTISPELDDGSYDIELTSRDPATNVVLANEIFKKVLIVRAIEPKISIKTDKSNDRSPEIMGEIDDPEAKVYVKINEKEYEAINNKDGTWSIPAGTIKPELTNGEYLVIARAIDIYGNEKIETKLLVIKADNQFGFVLPPNTGYFRIHHTNISTWIVYLLIVLGISAFAIKQRLSKQK